MGTWGKWSKWKSAADGISIRDNAVLEWLSVVEGMFVDASSHQKAMLQGQSLGRQKGEVDPLLG